MQPPDYRLLEELRAVLALGGPVAHAIRVELAVDHRVTIQDYETQIALHEAREEGLKKLPFFELPRIVGHLLQVEPYGFAYDPPAGYDVRFVGKHCNLNLLRYEGDGKAAAEAARTTLVKQISEAILTYFRI